MLSLLLEDPEAFNDLVDDLKKRGEDACSSPARPVGDRYQPPTEPWTGEAGILDRAGMTLMSQPGVAMVTGDMTGLDAFSHAEREHADREQRPARPTRQYSAVSLRWIAATARRRPEPIRSTGRSRERRAGATRTRGSRRRSGSSPPAGDDGPGGSDEPPGVAGRRLHETCEGAA